MLSTTAPDLMRDLLTRSRTIAMVGASTDPWRVSFGIMRYLQGVGYRVIPVNPQHAGETLHGERVAGRLAEVPEAVDLVNVFRRPEALAGVVDEAAAARMPAVWAQLGVRSEEAARRAAATGVQLVMDRCISVEHARLGMSRVAAGGAVR